MKYKFLLILFSISSISLFSQIRNFNFRNINISDGLSSNTITSIKQDKFGQIWFGTSNGLNKYNGINFTVYRNVPRDKYSLSNSEINDVLVDRDGYVWVGTINGLNRYDPKKNIFKRFYKRVSNRFSLTNSLIICSLEMPKGNIWFGTANGVSIYDKKNDRFKRFLLGNSKIDTKAIHDIYRDKENRIWLATSKGLIKVIFDENKKFVVKEYVLNSKRTNFNVNSILQLSTDVIGLGTKFNGYLYFNIKTEKFVHPAELDLPKNLDVRDLKFDNDKNLWLATTSGLFIITPENKTISLKENDEESIGATLNYTRKIYKDKNGSMWLGTQNHGIINWDKSYQNFLHLKNHNLYNNITNDIVKGANNNIYFGTEVGVLNVLDKKGDISEVFRINKEDNNISIPIKSLCFYNTNVLFIGTQNKGIITYDVKSKKIREDIISKKLNKFLEKDIIYDIKKDSNNHLFIGTFGKGLVVYNLITKKIVRFAKPEIATNIIKSIHIDKDNNAFIGGLGGVSFINFNEKRIPEINNYFKEKIFTTYNVNCVFKDSNNINWVGTTTRGLYRIEGEKVNQVRIVKRNKFSTVNSILEGEKGVLWLSTDRGIVKYNSKTAKSFLYNQNNIIAYNDFRQNSGLKIDNQFYFGHLNGVTTFNSKKIIKGNKVPKVILSELKIKNKIVPINGNDGVLSKSLKYTDVLELEHNNSNFSISYALPNYLNSIGNRYAYRLKGLDDSWVNTKQTEAFFTLQNAGEYEFQVKAANQDNVWNKKTTSLHIVIKPAPWQTWWAYTFYFIAVFGLFYGVSWVLQSKARLKSKLELEYLENQRIEELNKSKLQFFTNISHEFRTPLTLILGPLQNILDDYTGTSAIYKKLKIIDSSANHLLRLINRLMDFRKLESNQLVLKTAEGNIVKFLKEIYLSFSEHAKMGKYEYDFKSSDDEILVYFDRYKLERVFFNLISNAFRYTPEKGKISIIVEKGNENVILKVKDSGVGVSEEYLDKIFDRFFEIPIHNKYDKQYNKGTGIGLSIAKNIVKLHRGSIAVKNQKPNGAIFTVKLKRGNQHLLPSEIQEDFKKSDDVSLYAAQMNFSEIKQSNEIEDALLEDKEFTILIVEDNIVLRSFIKEILKPKYNVLLAENGKIALQKTIKHLPDLIVSDVIMPEMVGTELCSKIKTTLATSHIPVILLTSRTSLIYKFEGLESGADDYISKPFDLKEFQLKIHNLLTSKQRLKEKFSSKDNFTAIDLSLTSLDEQMLEKAFKIVKENISNQDFNIEDFSEALGVSRSMLFTKIKAWTNATPKDFIQEIRLKYAAQLLELDKLNISEISYKVGFKRPKYFSQCFQKKYGFTPSEYSKKFKSIE